MEVGDTACRPDVRPGVRQRIVTAAASQWRAFRYPVLDRTANSTTLIPTDNGAPIVSSQLNPSVPPENRTRAAPRLGLMEDDQAVSLAIGAYWAVTDPSEVDKQNRLWAVEPSTGWAVAWSAAFVSWVMCESGLTEDHFERSAAHITYIEDAYRSAGASNRAYRYEANGEGSIDPGDLICAWRGTADGLDFQEGSERLQEANAFHRLPASEQARREELGTAITGPVGTHCDIVVKVDMDRGRIYAIGGNVVQAVTMTILGFTLDGDRMRLETPPEHPGAPRWFAILRLNLPDAGSADLDSAFGDLRPPHSAPR